MAAKDLETLIRDSIAMENAKTFRDLDYVCRNIEARHSVEGIRELDRIAYEDEKAKHVRRVTLAIVA